jgi:hypothetical protein
MICQRAAPVRFQSLAAFRRRHSRTHGQASTDKLLKNHDCRGSRHNGGHKPLSPLILLMFLHQGIPCAMVYDLFRAHPGETGLCCHRRA